MDKIDRLLDAVENPGRFSDSEIQAMLKDHEVARVYDLLGKTKSSLQPVAEPDIDAEWRAFERGRAIKAPAIRRLFTRNVAAAIVVCVASFAAVAAVVGVSRHVAADVEPAATEAYVADARNTEYCADTLVADNVIDRPCKAIIFDNEPLENIMEQIAEHYCCKVEFKTEASKSLRLFFRWNKGLPLEDVVAGMNNFEQIRIVIKEQTIIID